MKKVLLLALVAMGIALPALGQFDSRTRGTREQTYLLFNTPPELPALPPAGYSLIVRDPACNCLKLSNDGISWITLGGSGGGGGGVTSIFGRSGVVTAQLGDYGAALVSATPFLTITGTTVQAQLQQINDRISNVTSVSSVFGRTGAIIAVAGDYDATKITSTVTGDVSATTVQAAIAELASEKINAASTSSISGAKTFTSFTTTPLTLQPTSAPSANFRMWEVKNAGGTSKAWADIEGDSSFNSVSAVGAISGATLSLTGNLTQSSSASTIAHDLVSTAAIGAATHSIKVGNGTRSDNSVYTFYGQHTPTGVRGWNIGMNGSDEFKLQYVSGVPLTPPSDVFVVDAATLTATASYPFTFNNAVSFWNSVGLGGSATATTPATSDNDTSVATTAYVKAQNYAPLASPALTGNPTGPTATAGDNDTSLATTAFVQNAVVSSVAGVASFNTRTGAVTPQQADYDSFFLTPTEGNAAYFPFTGGAITGATTSTSTLTVNGTTLGGGAHLQVNGTTNSVLRLASTSADSNATIQMANDAVTWQTYIDGSDSDAWKLRYVTGSTTRLAVSTGGAFTFTGTTSTSGRVQGGNSGSTVTSALALEGLGAHGASVTTATPVAALADSTAFASGVGGGLGFFGKYNTAANYTQFAQMQGFKESGTDGDTAGAWRVATRASGGSLAEAMRVSSTGRLGIKSTAPSSLLHVGAGSTVAAWFDSASEDGIAVATGTATSRVAIAGTGSADLILYDSGATADVKTAQLVNDDGTFTIYKVNDAFSSATSMLQFALATTDATFGAKVGVGAAPSVRFHVTDSSNTIARIESTGTDSASRLSLKNDGREWQAWVDGSSSDTLKISNTTAGTDAISITSANATTINGATTVTLDFNVSAPATNDDPNYKITQTRVATTDATVTTLQTIPISASNTYMVEARVVARRTGGSAGTADDGAAYVVRGTYKTASGTVTLIGSLSAMYTAEDQAGWDATLTISGSNVLVRVTGAANNNVTWHTTTILQNLGS